MVGLTHLEHHVVGDVDHVVDRAHARQGQPPRQPRRRGPDGHPFEDDGSEPRTEVLGLHLDRGLALAVPHRGVLRYREGNTELGGQVSGHAGDRHRIRAVRGDVELEDDVGLHAERLLQPGAGLGLDPEDEDAAVVVRQLELGG